MADAARFRSVVGRFATGVCVVTSDGPGGPAGLTTNAFTSVSLEPQLVLVCFDRGSRTLDAVRASERFAVNVLAAEQAEVARVFATKRAGADKLAAVAHRREHGLPLLDDALAWLACDLVSLTEAGDHWIGVGAVAALDAREDGEPLMFVDGSLG